MGMSMKNKERRGSGTDRDKGQMGSSRLQSLSAATQGEVSYDTHTHRERAFYSTRHCQTQSADLHPRPNTLLHSHHCYEWFLL